jgi:hypothetical protein
MKMTAKSFLISFRSKVSASIKAGGKPIDNRDDFIQGMAEIKKQRWFFLWIIVGMILVVFILTIGGIIYFVTKDKMDWMKTISTISGLSLTGMIYFMANLWRQVTGIEMAIRLANSLDPKDLLDIINSLLKTVYREKDDKP